jgi:hypothetical protein
MAMMQEIPCRDTDPLPKVSCLHEFISCHDLYSR